MARQIIIVTAQRQATGAGEFQVTAAFWLAVPANLVVPNPGVRSAVPLLANASYGVTANELSSLQAGTVQEQIYVQAVTNGQTKAQAQAALVTAYIAAQALLTSLALPVAVIGTAYDGSVWG